MLTASLDTNPRMDRRKPKDVLFAAFQCAKLDRASMANCYKIDTAEHKEALADIKAFEKLQMRIFGSTENAFDARLEGVPLLSIPEIREIMETEKNESEH